MMSETLTLNAQYYSRFYDLLNKNPNIASSILVFPQRIPRKGFFTELYELETTEYRKNLDSVINHLTSTHHKSFIKLIDDATEDNARQYINWSYILMRYGCFETIVKNHPEKYDGCYKLEIELIKETAKIEDALSNEKIAPINGLLKLTEKFIDDPNSTLYEKIKLLNQLVVHFYRHDRDINQQQRIFDLSKLLVEYLEKYQNENFINKHLCSIAYRGVAMASKFGTELQSSFLNKSLELAKAMQPVTELEEIVAAENLFTITQSLAKWHILNDDLKTAESCLLELTSIDPNDSTGYSELAFFYLNQHKYQEAETNFKKAMSLGPPGTGMNTYYYAKCLEQLEKHDEAINYLHLSTELDKYAISPWLDLLELHSKEKNPNKMREIATYILSNECLMEQLDKNEIIHIKNIIN
jgi:tetratricopeptide (TPR) repeat protein